MDSSVDIEVRLSDDKLPRAGIEWYFCKECVLGAKGAPSFFFLAFSIP